MQYAMTFSFYILLKNIVVHFRKALSKLLKNLQLFRIAENNVFYAMKFENKI
jgi:hypothetical protein